MKEKFFIPVFMLVFLISKVAAQENLARRPGVVVTASGFTNASESPEMAKDGNVATKWCDNKNQDKFLLFDLGVPCKISSFKLDWEDWDKTQKYQILTSSNNTDWKQAVLADNNSADPSEHLVKLNNVRYVMFLVMQDDDDAVRLNEFEIFGKITEGAAVESPSTSSGDETNNVQNLALLPGVTATASGYVNAAESPDKAHDGNTDTKWCDNNSLDKWLQFDLNAICDIKRVILDWEDWDINKLYKIQTSEDGNSWADKISETDNDIDRKTYEADWKNVRFIRFLVPAAANDDAVRLMEMEVYGIVRKKVDKAAEKKEELVVPVFLRSVGKKKIYDLARYVDTKVGVADASGSNCVIGPQLPSASINPSPQTPGGENDGYVPGQPVRGFGQLHVSGTGWGKYGHFLISPQIGLKPGNTEHDSPVSGEITEANYYKADLDRYKIKAEVTPAKNAAIYRFTFPEANDANIAMDVTHSITRDIATYIGGTVKSNNVYIDPQSKNSFWGMIEYEGGFGGGFYKLHFYAQIDKIPTAYGVWKNGEILPGQLHAELNNKEDRIGSYFTFNTHQDDTVQLKIAISFKSVDQAKKYLQEQIPHWSFDRVRKEGVEIWNEALSSIIIPEASAKELKMFYSAMYHSMLMPRDRRGEFEQFDNKDIWDDHYAVWDTWRTVFPLYMLINPGVVSSNINAFINRFKVNGKVKDAFIAGIDMEEDQGGNNVDNIIAEAIIKDIPGFDKKEAYAVLKQNAEKERRASPLILSEKGAVQNDPEAYRQTGWVPAGVMSNSISLEYSYNDYCTALAAKKLGLVNDFTKYKARSSKWINLWNPDLESKGFRGFIVPKTKDGKWVEIDPAHNPGSWKNYFYEANSWTYSYFIPHEINKLIELNGGKEKYVEKLDFAFRNNLIELANEPSFLTVRTFNNARRTDLNCYWVNHIVKNLYGEYNVPGNDDSGAMSSWYIFSALGFFPNAGQNTYYINTPLYKKAIIQRAEGDIVIEAPGVSAKNIYTGSVNINGKKLLNSWFDYEDIKRGAVISFEVKESAVKW